MGSNEVSPHPVGLPNPRIRPCCELHRADGRVSNFCYQNAVFQCLASLPWTRSMLPKTGRLQEEFWELLNVLVSEDEKMAFTRVPDFIVGFGVRVDEQFINGLFRNCHQQVCLAQCDAGEFFLRFLDKLYGDLDEISPFNFSMDVQHFETRDLGYRQLDSKHVMSATESHSCLIVEPVFPELNACIAASYDERNVVQEKRPGRFSFSLSKTVEIVKSKQASVVLPGPKFLAIYIKRVRGVQRRGYRAIRNIKDERSISIPLRDFQLEGKSSLNYHCCGVVCHAGQSVDAGHYVAYVRRGTNWFFCDDDHIVMLHPNQFGARNVFEPAGGEHHVPCIVFFEASAIRERSSSPLLDTFHGMKASDMNTPSAASSDDDPRPSTAGAALPHNLSPGSRPSPPSRAQPCASCARKNQTIKFLREQVAQLQKKIEEMRSSQLNEVRVATANTEASLAALQTHFQESVESQQAMQDQIHALKEECSEKNTVIDTLRSQIARTEKALSDSASQDARRLEQCLLVEKKRCRAVAEQLKTTNRDLNRQLEQLQLGQSYLRRDLTDSQREAGALSRHVTELERDNAHLREQILRERQALRLRAGTSSISSAPRPASAQLRSTRRYPSAYPSR